MGIADGPTEVHKITIAKQVLRDYEAVDGLFPSAHIPTRRAAAREKYTDLFEQEIGVSPASLTGVLQDTGLML